MTPTKPATIAKLKASGRLSQFDEIILTSKSQRSAACKIAWLLLKANPAMGQSLAMRSAWVKVKAGPFRSNYRVVSERMGPKINKRAAAKRQAKKIVGSRPLAPMTLEQYREAKAA